MDRTQATTVWEAYKNGMPNISLQEAVDQLIYDDYRVDQLCTVQSYQKDGSTAIYPVKVLIIVSK